MTDLAKLSVLLEAQTTKYMQALQKSERRTDQFRKRLDQQMKKSSMSFDEFGSQVNRSIGLLKALAASAIIAIPARFISNTVKATDDLIKMGHTLGVSGGEMQRLQHFTERTGVSLETISKAMKALTRRTSEALSGNKNYQKSLDALGISAEELLALPQEEAFALVARRLGEMSDRGLQTSTGYNLLSESVFQLLGVINTNADALQDITDDFKTFNLALTDVESAAIEDLADTFTDVSTATSLAASKFTAQLAPALSVLAEEFFLANSRSGELGDGISSVTGKIVSAVASVLDFTEAVDRLIEINKQLVGILTFDRTSSFAQIGDLLTDPLTRGDKFLADLEAKLESLRSAASKPPRPGGVLDPSRINDQTSAVEQQIQALEKRLVLLRAQAAGASKFDLKLLEMFQGQRFTPAQADRATLLMREIQALDTLLTSKAEDAKLAQELAGLYERHEAAILGVSDAQLSYTRKAEELNQLLRHGKISQEQMTAALAQYGKALEDAGAKTNEFGISIDELGRSAARNIHSAFADFLFDPFEQGLDGMLQSFAVTLRRMAAEAAAAQILGNIFTGDGGLGGLLGGIFGGAKADGGDIVPNKMYIAGDGGGPELITSRSMAHVFDAGETRDIMGAGTQNFYITTPDADSFRASERQIARRQRLGMLK